MLAQVDVLPDRGHLSPDSGVGFDTVAVKWPTDYAILDELDRIHLDRHLDTATGELLDTPIGGRLWVPAGMSQAHVSVVIDRHRGPEMRVEVSLPMMVSGTNWNIERTDRLEPAIAELLRHLGDSLSFVPDVGQLRVVRLDLSRDFDGVRDPAATLASIARHPFANAHVDESRRRPDGSTQSLTRGNKNYWLARGYDKSYEATTVGGLRVPPGRLRFEAQLRSKELGRFSLNSLDALMSTNLHDLARYYFERTKFHVNTAVTSAGDVIDMLSTEAVSVADQRNVQILLFSEMHGIEPLLTRHTLQRARAIVRRYNLTADSIGRTTFQRRLDFERGIEVVE